MFLKKQLPFIWVVRVDISILGHVNISHHFLDGTLSFLNGKLDAFNFSLDDDDFVEFVGHARPLCIMFLCTASVFTRSEEHTSELQSLMRISYAVFCLKKKRRPSEYGRSSASMRST